MEQLVSATTEDRPDDIQSRAKQYAAQAKTFAVDTSEDYAGGIEAMKRLKRMRKSWDDLQRPAIRAAKAAHEEALRVFKSIDNELEAAFDTIKERCEVWVEARREAQRRQLAEQAAKMTVTPVTTEAALGPAFDQAVAQGDTEKAAKILDQAAMPTPMQAPPPLPPVTAANTFVPKVAGAAVSTPWTYDILDESLIPREYLCVDRKKIAAVVKAMKGDTRIPGIHARPDTALSVRG
jgi:hypothetical protein